MPGILIGFTLDDMETYEKERGFFWQDVRQWLPGEEIYTFDGFYGCIENVLRGQDPGWEKRHAIGAMMQKYRDDHNSERVLRALHIVS